VRTSASTLADLLECGRGDAVALVEPEGGLGLTYQQVAARVESLAGRLQALGIQRRDRVALVLPNGPELLHLLLATVSIGAAAAPLNPGYTKDEFSFYLGDLDPQLLLLPLRHGRAARAAKPENLRLVEVGGEDGRIELDSETRAVRKARPHEPPKPDDIALLLHTSGTTSRPKQVPLLHQNLVASANAIAESYALDADDVSFCLMPLFHVHGLLASALATLLSGGTVVVPRRVNPRRVPVQLREYHVSWFSGGPTLHHMLLETQPAKATRVPSLRFLRSCSSALSPALLARAEAHYGVPMLEAYGMTEASHQICSNPLPPAPHHAGSVGRPTGTRVRIVNRAGHEVEGGHSGEVQIQGPGVTPGYLHDANANAEAFTDDWFRTGDQGVVEDGYLRLQGRLKEMIIRGSENISPLEVEEVLLSHPAVADAACFGIPDEKYGEEIAAAVALHTQASERELINHCRERLIRFKIPKAVYVLDSIPRTTTGKLQRKRLASHLLDQRR
jgi:acyl-CoA synthetase (AMP-forming)/AMP-acid ligase II